MDLVYVSDAQVFAASALSCAVVVIWLGVAAFIHRGRLMKVPVRVHVAGSRGKTSTARLIGAGLRSAGLRVLVKTTGTDPLLILPDGAERQWPRWSPPTIAEQVRFFREAVRLKADAVVLESMAVEPEYLWASERYLVRATHVAITNVRPDHAETLGGDATAMAAATSLVVPSYGQLFVTEEAAVEAILTRAARRGARVRIVPVTHLAPAEANRRLALSVCEALGISTDGAALAMNGAGDDPGSFFVADFEIRGLRFRFANAFACNDLASFQQLWAEHHTERAVVVLLNARQDRPLRTRAFLEVLAGLEPPITLFLSGGAPRGWALEAGFPPERTNSLRGSDAETALLELAAVAGPKGTIWGVGNYAGLGAQIVRRLRQKRPTC